MPHTLEQLENELHSPQFPSVKKIKEKHEIKQASQNLELPIYKIDNNKVISHQKLKI